MPTRGENKRRTISLEMPDGSVRRRDIYAPTDDELDKKEKELLIAAAKGAICSTMRFDTWCDRWLEVYKKNTVDTNTYNKYKSLIDLHIKPSFSGMRMNMIKHIHLQNCLNSCAGLSRSMLQKVRYTLLQIFTDARTNDLITSEFRSKLYLPDSEAGTRRELTETERAAILKACEYHRAGPWILTMLCCGLRRGETVPLEWTDIDFDKRTISINKAVKFEGNKSILTTTKTAAGVRTVPMPNLLVEALRRQPRHISSQLVFPTASGKMMTLTNLRRLWDSFIREADRAAGAEIYRNKIKKPVLPGQYDDKKYYQYELTPHYLRHTYATDLYSAGVDLKTAQYLLGHADVKTTANIYTHAAKNKTSSAADCLDAYYAGQVRDGTK